MDLRHYAGGLCIAAAAAAALGATTAGCGEGTPQPPIHGQVHITLLHTSDIHSRLYPYNLQLGQVDAGLGLGAADQIVNVGGAARMSHIIGRERARASRVLHLDGGDCFQGAPVFNFYAGEAEVRTLSAMGADAMIIANHEFDWGATNLSTQLQKWASFPVLAANYHFDSPTTPGAPALGSIVVPWTSFTLGGLKVGVVGMGNLSSLTSIFDTPNKLGILPLNTIETAQAYVDLLRPLVDVIVFVTHLGLDVDQYMIENTEGIDVVLGGHNHIVLQPPKRVQDCTANEEVDESGEVKNYILIDDPDHEEQKIKRYCKPRDVLLTHSGAFAKYVGRLDAIFSDDAKDFPSGSYDAANGFELVSHEYTLFPVTEQVPEDPIVASLLEPYSQGLDTLANLDLLVGYALDGSKRNATNGGDSPLGNLISTAMWLRLGIQTDFSLTNTTGIRADLVPGPVTVEQMYNIFPFDNSISKMQLSGVEVQELFDFVARRSAGRACKSQAQIAGARIVINCVEQDPDEEDKGIATNIYIGALFCSSETPDRCNPGTCDSDRGVCGCSTDVDCPCICDGEPCCGSDGVCGSAEDQVRCDEARKGMCDVDTKICWQPIDRIATYELATSNYLAQGGSGFRVLQRNTTQLDTKVQQRDALIDFIRAGDPCGADQSTGEAKSCSTDSDCADLGDGYVCACPEAVVEGTECETAEGGSCSGGACVLAQCRIDVAAFQRDTCADAPSEGVKEDCEKALAPCASAGEQCKFLSCIDRDLGNYSDGRITMEGQ